MWHSHTVEFSKENSIWKLTHAYHRSCEQDVETESSMQFGACTHDHPFLLSPSCLGCYKKKKDSINNQGCHHYDIHRTFYNNENLVNIHLQSFSIFKPRHFVKQNAHSRYQL